jgi:2-hydroxycyclohexanecarboxyl-CoA dehydrogenase
MNRLAGKTALVTGAAAGIGAALAQLFCQQGAAVTLVDQDQEALAQTHAHLMALLPQAKLACVVADVGDRAGAQPAVEKALQAHGSLDILINNAAMRNHASLMDATQDEWQALLDVNVLGTASFCRFALPALRAGASLGRKPSIVNVSSCYAVMGRKGMGLYDASKAALLAMTRTLAHEEAEHGIRVNAVCPGSTLTDFHLNKARSLGKPIHELQNARQSTSLLARWATPLEIAWPILWLASDEASFITGSTLMVDGGLHIK